MAPKDRKKDLEAAQRRAKREGDSHTCAAISKSSAADLDPTAQGDVRALMPFEAALAAVAIIVAREGSCPDGIIMTELDFVHLIMSAKHCSKARARVYFRRMLRGRLYEMASVVKE